MRKFRSGGTLGFYTGPHSDMVQGMKRHWKHILSVGLLTGTLCAHGAGAEAPELWFPVGEKLIYSIHWGWIPVGSSVVTTEWVDGEQEGHPRTLLRIRVRTRTNKVLGSLYPVDDVIESIIDPETFLPLRFRKKLSEGRYRCDETTVFDHAGGTATWTAKRFKKKKLLTDEPDKEKTYEIEPDTRDLISFMYFLRQQTFEPGKEVTSRVMADEKVYDIEIHPEKFESVKLDAYGKVRSLKMEPKAAFEGLFVHNGSIWVWQADDERGILTQVQAEVPVAKVSLKLYAVRGPGDDKWIRKAPGKNDEIAEDHEDAEPVPEEEDEHDD